MISYKPLFITLAEKEMTINDLKTNGVISSATQAKFAKRQNVRIDIIAKICTYLDVPIEKVVEVLR